MTLYVMEKNTGRPHFAGCCLHSSGGLGRRKEKNRNRVCWLMMPNLFLAYPEDLAALCLAFCALRDDLGLLTNVIVRLTLFAWRLGGDNQRR